MPSVVIYTTYQNRLRLIWEMKHKHALASNTGLFDKQTQKIDKGKLFCKYLNQLCKSSFRWCMTECQYYSMPIVSTTDFLVFIHLTKKVFDPQWYFLVGLQNIWYNNSKPLKAYKKQQVFCQILALQHMANFWKLTYWSLIQTTAYYGLGVESSVTDASTFWGNSVGNSFCDAEFMRLYHNLSQFQRVLLKKYKSRLFEYNNCQEGQWLREQRGQSSIFLSGTHSITQKTVPCSDRSHNVIKVESTYDQDQLNIYLVGMRVYEITPLDAPDADTQDFVKHSVILTSAAPDATRECVRHYNLFSIATLHLTTMNNVSSHTNEHF